MIRTVLLGLLFALIPLALVAGGIHGIVTGHFTYKRGHAYGISARVLSSSAIFAGLAVLRAYWLIIREREFEPDDPIMRGLLVLTAAALVVGLVLVAFSVAF